MLIIDDLFLWLPLKGLVAISRRLEDMIREEQRLDSDLSRQLVENQLRFEMGEVDEADFKKREEKIIDKINAKRNERESDIEKQKK